MGGAGSAGGASGSESCDVPSGDGALEAFYSKGSVANAFWQGNSAAIDCDTFAIGDPTVSDGAAKAGKVHVYAWDGAAWSEQDHLAITSPYTVDLFGSSVALEGDTLVAGAPHRNACDKPDCTQSVGMAYIFTRSGSTWTQTKELASASQHYLALYGMSVAISGSTIAVAAPWQRVPTVNDDGSTSTKNQGGMVEIWTKGPKNWVYSTNIIAPGLQSSEYAGTGLALSGETLVIGAPGNLDQSIARPGRVFVYSGAGSTWEHQATLLADDGDKGDGFGHSVAYASDLVVVGAPQRNLTVSAGDAGGLLADVGGVYVFSGSGADLTQTAILEAPNAVAGAEFGYSLAAVSSTRVVVGAPGVKSVYVFDQLDGTWTLTATHTACSDGLGGGSLAAFGNFAVTATKEDSPGAWLIDLADPDTSCIE